MKVILTDETARVIQEPNAESLSITTMHRGDEFDVGKVTRKKKEVWVAVTLPSGTTGYIVGNTTIFAIKRVEATGHDVELHRSADNESEVVSTIAKRTAFVVRGFEKVEDKDWFLAEDTNGVRGYIPANTKLRVVPEVSRSSARRMMVTGGVFVLIGIVVFVFSQFSPPQTGDTSFISIGLVLLGLFQAFQGYMQYRQAAKNEDKK